ncbi:MAG: hypothetical protein LLG01_12665 [Planctomycetaceae bacterium]|nr:hypothetical protein [Planctomycetaceae bacterium]
MKIFEVNAGERETFVVLKDQGGREALYEFQSNARKFSAQLVKVPLLLAKSVLGKLKKK